MANSHSIDIVLPMYNGKDYIRKTLDALVTHRANASLPINIIVVNDCSNDGGEKLIEHNYKDIRLINLSENVGRSKARNIGANSGSSQIILFIDSDCALTEDVSLRSLVTYFDQGYELCFGRIDSDSSGFWGQYLDKIAKKRHHLGKQNSYLSFTSQIFALKRELFERIHGFNEQYSHYGFEDRDMFLRIQKNNANILYAYDLVATTVDLLSLNDVCTKMELSARHSAKIFYSDHPEEYKNMVYGKIDSRIHPITTFPLKLMNRIFLSSFKSIGNFLLNQKFCPYKIKHVIVKSLTALYYVKGTYTN